MIERENTSSPPQQPVRVPRGLSLEHAYELGRDRAILKMQESIRTLTAQIQQLMNQLRGREREPPQDPPGGSDSPHNSQYGSESSTGDARPRRRRMHRDDLEDLKMEAPEFDESLKPEDYLEWV